MKNIKDRFSMEFLSTSANEGFARTVTAVFVTRLNPSLEEISDLKTAVSEAVTNAIIHGYPDIEGIISLRCELDNNEVTVEIEDRGVGIADIEKAKEPLFTTKSELERSGMGFCFMEAFTDELTVISKPYEGTLIRMKKKIGGT